MTNDSKPTLREVALRASERVGGLQGRALDREAKRRGLVLSYTTVDKIIAGTYNSRPTAKTLQALSELSGMPLAQVYAAANEPQPTMRLAEQLPADADLLEGDQRRVVIDTVRVFARYNRELDRARREAEESLHGYQPAATNQARGSRAELGALRDAMLVAFEDYVEAANGVLRSSGRDKVARDALLDRIRAQFADRIASTFAQADPDSSERRA